MTSPINKHMTFSEAIIKVTDGQKITREIWGDNQYYGVLKNTLLQLHKPNGKYYAWTINEGDLLGEDWIIIRDN